MNCKGWAIGLWTLGIFIPLCLVPEALSLPPCGEEYRSKVKMELLSSPVWDAETGLLRATFLFRLPSGDKPAILVIEATDPGVVAANPDGFCTWENRTYPYYFIGKGEKSLTLYLKVSSEVMLTRYWRFKGKIWLCPDAKKVKKKFKILDPYLKKNDLDYLPFRINDRLKRKGEKVTFELDPLKDEHSYLPSVEGTSGVIIQPWEEVLSPRVPWATFLDDMAYRGVNKIILQFSVWNGQPIYRWHKDSLHSLLRETRKRDMEVFMGLSYEDKFYRAIEKEGLPKYLSHILKKEKALLKALERGFGKHKNLVGYYLPYELDNYHFRTPKGFETIQSFFASLTRFIKKKTGRRIAMAGYFAPSSRDSEWLNPVATGRWWQKFLSSPTIDLLLLIDGIGTGINDLNLEQLAYYASIADAAKKEGVRMDILVENFTQIAGEPLTKGEFLAVPAPPKRVRDQRVAATPFCRSLWEEFLPNNLLPLVSPAQWPVPLSP